MLHIVDETGTPVKLFTGYDALNALALIESLSADEADFVANDPDGE